MARNRVHTEEVTGQQRSTAAAVAVTDQRGSQLVGPTLRKPLNNRSASNSHRRGHWFECGRPALLALNGSCSLVYGYWRCAWSPCIISP
jgi:hypothetical protein